MEMEITTAGPAARLRTGSMLVACGLALFLGSGAPTPAHAEAEVNRIVYAVPEAVPLLSRSYGLGEPLRILVTDDRVSPRRAVLRRGQRAEWASRAGHALRIVFDAEVARSMVCDGLVHFSLDGSELRSGQLPPGETARFCELAPGVYPYHVELAAPAGGEAALPGRPEGVLVVPAD
jgi:hypothetical protein